MTSCLRVTVHNMACPNPGRPRGAASLPDALIFAFVLLAAFTQVSFSQPCSGVLAPVSQPSFTAQGRAGWEGTKSFVLSLIRSLMFMFIVVSAAMSNKLCCYSSASLQEQTIQCPEQQRGSVLCPP